MTVKTNCPTMLNTTKAIKQDYANHAMIESNILHGIKLIQRLMADMVQAVANADECKRLYDKRDIINECLEDAAYSNAHIIVNTASAILSAPIMKAYNEAACSFKCLTQATTFAEYSEQRKYFVNRRNIFNFRCHNVQVASTERYNAAMKWVEYYNKQIAYWAAARLPRVAINKKARRAAIAQFNAAWLDINTGKSCYWQPLQTAEHPFKMWALALRLNYQVFTKSAVNYW